MDERAVLLPCTVESVRVHALTGQHVVLLQPKDSANKPDKLLPIWIGADQAYSIATCIAGIKSERPLTHDLVMTMLGRLGVELTRVVVKDLVSDETGQGGVFHGSVFLHSSDGEVEIDSRASDAIALAVRCDARILVAESVLDRSAISSDASEDESDLKVFKEFIEALPDDAEKKTDPNG